MQIMDPVMYSSDIKALGISDGVLSCLEGFSSMKDTTPEWDYGRSRKSDKSVVMKDTPTEWDYGRSCSSDKPVVMTPYKVTEIPRFMDRFPGGTQKTSYGSFGESLGNNFCRSQVVTSAPSFTLKASSSEEVTCSKNSSSVINSDAWESSIIDLQLGRLSDSRTSKNCKVIHAVENLQMPESPLPTKKIKSTSLVGQNPICQVLDCNMDLSSFKDYYKRHKVCEVHSKTARVIVNDKLQRFCQQCSSEGIRISHRGEELCKRQCSCESYGDISSTKSEVCDCDSASKFHKLSEFDDCKRSCRKRLACHNERRRKPQIDIYPVRIARMMQPSYHGLNFSGSNISDFNSLVSPDVLAYNIAMEVKTENANRLRSASSCENEPQNDVQVPALYQHLLPGRHDSLNDINSASKIISYEDRNQYDLRFDASSWEFDNSLNSKAFPGISVSSCAHSLLSSQPERSSFYPLLIPVSTDQLVTPQEVNNSILQTRPTSSSSYYQSGVSTIPGDIWSKDLSML